MHYFRVFIPLFSGFLISVSTNSYAHDVSGYVGIEGQLFQNEPLFNEQSDNNGSLTNEIEYFHDMGEGNQRVAVTTFARIDSEYSGRTHVDFREFYFQQNFEEFTFYVGARKIFWGVTESVHLVDIINQTDVLENIDGEDKLGQPMIQFTSARHWGTVSAFVLPYFREREYPGENSRLRAGLPIVEDAVYQSDKEEEHIDFALRYSHYIDSWDFGLSHFSGTSRSPIFLPFQDRSEQKWLPMYRQLEQTGIDLQATVEAWLLKLEAISIKDDDIGRNTAFAGGIEYTFYNVLDRTGDLGVVIEYQFDDRTGARQVSTQNDFVLGARYVFNDVDATQVLALFAQDLDDDNLFFSVEFSKRLTNHWKLEAEARVFSSIEASTHEYDFREDSYIQLDLRRYF